MIMVNISTRLVGARLFKPKYQSIFYCNHFSRSKGLAFSSDAVLMSFKFLKLVLMTSMHAKKSGNRNDSCHLTVSISR